MTTKIVTIIFFLFMFNTSNLMAQTQAEMTETANANYKKADAELNKTYQVLLKKVSGKQKKQLIKSQKDWLKFRDSHCEFTADQYAGGSMRPMVYLTCLEERTTKRTSDLKVALEERNK